MSQHTIVRAEAYYKPRAARPGRPVADWSHIPVAERIFHWYLDWLGRRVNPPSTVVSELVYARVNHSRWLGDCGACGNAQYVSPTDARMACPECGYAWVTVVWPADPVAVETSMLALPLVRDRNWWHPADPNNPNSQQPVEPEPGP
jgi:hypothetical protein